ncbi:MAG: hypothetical protein ACREQ5_21395, partial [Candidatus Dormibacteria bacterium]
MARRRQAAATVRRGRAVNVEATRRAADAFLSRFGNLADEVVALREALTEAQEENQQLRAELAEGIGLLRDATALVARAEPAKRGRRGRALRAAIAAAPPAAGPTRSRAATITASATGRPRRASANGRATPASVTADVVRAVIGKLGT